MSDYTLVNLKTGVEDVAPRFGMSPNMESRFARKPLELEKSGLSYFKIAAGFRAPFGHTHTEQEEVYVVLSGSAQMKVEDELVDLRPRDPKRVEILAVGAPNTDNQDAEMKPGWWTD
jgi:mannose-6-phosphate isomerase-like protein (cupin superfamily)